MGAIIFSVICIIGGIIASIITASCGYGKRAWVGATAGFLVAAIIFVFCSIITIPTGMTGVVTSFGRVEDYTYDAGVHMQAPWKTVITMDNRIQKQTMKFSCFSADIQDVTCIYTINYQIDKENAQEIYRTIGKDYFDTVVTPAIAESIKTIMAHYTAEELIGSRDTLALQIEDTLSNSLVPYNIKVVSTAIEDIDFTDAFTNAVEAKQVAAQNKLKAQIEQEQKTIESQQAAERAKIDAEAAANVAKIAAQADLEVQQINADAAEYTGRKEASKNKAIAESLTPDLLNYYYITQWDGVLPSNYVGSDNVSAIVGLD